MLGSPRQQGHGESLQAGPIAGARACTGKARRGVPGEAAEGRTEPERPARSHAALTAVRLNGLAVLMAILAAVLLLKLPGHPRPGDRLDKTTVPDGTVVPLPRDISSVDERPEPVGDPDRIRQMYEVGTTYAHRTKGGFVARATCAHADGSEQPFHLAHAFEMLVLRTIESNDGRRIVETRRYERVWAVTLIGEAGGPAIDLGPPGEPLLDALGDIEPHVGTRRVPVKPVAEAILRGGAGQDVPPGTSKAFWEVHPLSGKTVRMVYVDGVGVESVQPLGCSVRAEDPSFLFSLPVLWDARLFADEKTGRGEAWSVDGSLFLGFMPPSTLHVLYGEIALKRDKDCRKGGEEYAQLRVDGRPPPADPEETIAPSGAFQYNLKSRRVGMAELAWQVGAFVVTDLYRPESRRLGQIVVHSRPVLTVRYQCTTMPSPSFRPDERGGMAWLICRSRLGGVLGETSSSVR